MKTSISYMYAYTNYMCSCLLNLFDMFLCLYHTYDVIPLLQVKSKLKCPSLSKITIM